MTTQTKKCKKLLINEKGKIFDTASVDFRTKNPRYRNCFYQKGKYIKVCLTVKSVSVLLKQVRKAGKDFIMEVPKIRGEQIIFNTDNEQEKIKVSLTPFKKQSTFNWPRHKN